MSHLSLHRHPEVSLEVIDGTLLMLQENPSDFLLELGCSRVKVGASPPASLIRSSENSYHDSELVITSFVKVFVLCCCQEFNLLEECASTCAPKSSGLL